MPPTRRTDANDPLPSYAAHDFCIAKLTHSPISLLAGQTIQFEFRSAEGKPNLLRGLADELIRLKVDME